MVISSQVLGSETIFSDLEEQGFKIRKKTKKRGFLGYEIYGIGGLGAKTAANMWADCGLSQDLRLSSWFLSGTERRGTEVRMLGTITDLNNLERLGYELPKKDLFVFFSENTIKSDFEQYSKTGESLFAKANLGATVIINSQKSAGNLVEDFPYLGYFDVFTINAFAKIPNMQMIAATIKVTGVASYEILEEKIEKKFRIKSDKIVNQIQEALSSMSYQPFVLDSEPDFKSKKINRKWVPDGGYSSPDWGSSNGAIEKMKLGKNYYIDLEKCNRCGRCYEVCPENAIRGFWPQKEAKQPPGALKKDGGEKYFILQEYCKACGMCVSACTFKGAIKEDGK